MAQAATAWWFALPQYEHFSLVPFVLQCKQHGKIKTMT
jgi:hypothetical protein